MTPGLTGWQKGNVHSLYTQDHRSIGFTVDLIKIVEEAVETYRRLGDLGRSVAINSLLHSDPLTTFKC